MVGLDYVIARSGGLDLVGEVASGEVADLQVCLQLVLRLVGLGELETQLLVRVNLH